MEETLVPIVIVGGLWVMLGSVGVTALLAMRSATRDLHETMRRSIESGQPLTPEAIRHLRRPPRSPARDLRTGAILCVTAVGLGACAGLIAAVDRSDDWLGVASAAIVVGSIGLGHLVASRVRQDPV